MFEFKDGNSYQTKKNNGCCQCCKGYCWCWVLQIFTWLALFFVIIFGITQINIIIIPGPIFLFFYIIYFICELCSDFSLILLNKTSGKEFKDKIGLYFMTPPEIEFYCECYNESWDEYSETSENGTRTHYTTYSRSTSYEEISNFNYYSERDVSGPLILEDKRAIKENKYFIKLLLDQEITFGDSMSFMDKEMAKNNVRNRNKGKDASIRLVEYRYIPGLNNNNSFLILIGNKEPCSLNFCFFVFFTFIGFSELYKCYFNSYIYKQSFSIKKICSTRFDLNQPIYNEFVPYIKLNNERYDFGPEFFNYINGDFQPKYTNDIELENAKRYEEFVPFSPSINSNNNNNNINNINNINFFNIRKENESKEDIININKHINVDNLPPSLPGVSGRRKFLEPIQAIQVKVDGNY